MTVIPLVLQEWQECWPEQDTPLAGLTFGADEKARHVAETLTKSGRLTILELAKGIAVSANSFVGRVEVGPLRITVQPKIQGAPLLGLLRYAYRLRDIDLHPSVDYQTIPESLQELLVYQLVAETTELISRGLVREYVPVAEMLTSPRGRIDLQTYARQAGTITASLPCIHYPRLQDSILNRVLSGGLYLAIEETQSLPMRGQLRRLAKLIEPDVSRISLTPLALQGAYHELDRRTAAYRPALDIIKLLLQSLGSAFENGKNDVRLPGFLFDMNRLFQAVLSRFLQEHLVGMTVKDESPIRDLLAYNPSYNPNHRQAPTPRPDFVIFDKTKIAVILDAKYRDLWSNPLPRDMLYQLAIYALSQEFGATATILYPTMEASAGEARIDINDLVLGAGRAQIVLRPVRLLEFERLLSSRNNMHTSRWREAYAKYLAFGTTG
jgi:5-methylcytosine-specific restriction enzyme subunit McrC